MQCVIERYCHNPAKLAGQDVAERVFDITGDTIRLTYHHEPDRIPASMQEFMKPPNLEEMREGTVNMSEFLISYQVIIFSMLTIEMLFVHEEFKIASHNTGKCVSICWQNKSLSIFWIFYLPQSNLS